MKQLLLSIIFFSATGVFAQTTCATAVNIDVNGACASGAVNDATVAAEGYTCGGTLRREYWFKFTLSSSSTLNINGSSSNRDLALQLLQGTCGALTQITCANATSNNGGHSEAITNRALAAGTYYLRVLNVGNNNNMTLSSLCITTVPDCAEAIQICSDANLAGNSGGFGTQELNASNRGCLLGNEHQSSWYYFSPATSGTLEMEIQTTVDYDFAIWQTGNCGSLGTPSRCSFSANTGNTGLKATEWGQTSSFGCGWLNLFPCYGNIPITQTTEDDNGDKYVAALTVAAGQTYILLVDNYTADGTSYTLDFTLSNGATLNCTPIALPTEITAFKGEAAGAVNSLYWSVASELNCDHYSVERSTDALHWMPVENVLAGENSYGEKLYTIEDRSFKRNNLNYYRLLQTDKQGVQKFYMDYVALDNRSENVAVERIVNMMGQEVELATSGVIIIQYADGTIERRYNP